MSTFADTFIAENLDNFPSESLVMLCKKLQALSETQGNLITSTQFKHPVVALILSIFFGGLGVQRFYLGQIKIGVAKLLFSWFTLGIWILVDWFLIMEATKKVNLQKIHAVIN